MDDLPGAERGCNERVWQIAYGAIPRISAVLHGLLQPTHLVQSGERYAPAIVPGRQKRAEGVHVGDNCLEVDNHQPQNIDTSFPAPTRLLLPYSLGLMSESDLKF